MKTHFPFFPFAACLMLAASFSSTAQERTRPVSDRALRAIDTTVNVSVNDKWNLLSAPLLAAQMHKDSLYPGSVSNAFAFANGYYTENDLVMGKGYWLKFAGAASIPLIGTAVHKDTFDVVEGWNMVGSISDAVPVGSVTTIPGSMTLSSFWAYNNGYTHPSSLIPGAGYWVKASADGEIVLNGGQLAAPRAASDLYGGLHRLVIEDARGMKQTLWFGEATAKHAGTVVEMPPAPPSGIFDARFSDNAWGEFYSGGGEHRFAATVRSAEYPVTVRWELDASDRREMMLNETVRMTGKGSAVIPAGGAIGIRAGSAGVPAAYAMRQNYPNPFNPATNISFDLPEDAAVKLTVYDLLGRQVAVLADGVEPAGVHSVVFDAAKLTSGVYFYRLEAGAFTDTKKLVIMK